MLYGEPLDRTILALGFSFRCFSLHFCTVATLQSLHNWSITVSVAVPMHRINSSFIFKIISRALRRWGGRSDYASVLPFWRHRQYCFPYGVHWAAWVSLCTTSLCAVALCIFYFWSHVLVFSRCPSAYRIHVNMTTVKILRSLNEGYKIDVRGKTELKVTSTIIEAEI